MRDPRQTKHRLIEVASKLMADSGVAGLRVDQVAALAEINKRMIYHYFGDKQGLTAKVIAQQVSAITPLLNEHEANALLHLVVDHRAASPTGTVRSVAQPSMQGQQQAAVIAMRALLDRWQQLSETADQPIQSLLCRLSALALGREPRPAHAAEPAASSPQPPQKEKERISLRPTVNMIHSPSLEPKDPP